jgi:hypothetical protein
MRLVIAPEVSWATSSSSPTVSVPPARRSPLRISSSHSSMPSGASRRRTSVSSWRAARRRRQAIAFAEASRSGSSVARNASIVSTRSRCELVVAMPTNIAA